MNNKEYLVISRSNGTTKTGSPWASLKVANLIETINVAVWDMAPTAEPQVGQLVVFYNLKDNDGKKSCDFRDLKCCGEPLFDHELYNLLPRPIRRDIWDDTIKKLLSYCSDKPLMAIIEERRKEEFKDLADIAARVPSVKNPEKLIVARIMLEIMDADRKRCVKVWSFRNGQNAEIRGDYPKHGVRVFSCRDDGDVFFAVYGYMNRGKREGSCGISLLRYDAPLLQ